jgi:hypothetical protein
MHQGTCRYGLKEVHISLHTPIHVDLQTHVNIFTRWGKFNHNKSNYVWVFSISSIGKLNKYKYDPLHGKGNVTWEQIIMHIKTIIASNSSHNDSTLYWNFKQFFFIPNIFHLNAWIFMEHAHPSYVHIICKIHLLSSILHS